MLSTDEKTPELPVFGDFQAMTEHFASEIVPEYLLIVSFFPSTGEFRTIVNNSKVMSSAGKADELIEYKESFLSNVYPEDREDLLNLISAERLKLLTETSFVRKTERLRFRISHDDKLEWMEIVCVTEDIASKYHGLVTVALKSCNKLVEQEQNAEFNRMISSLIVNSYAAVYEYVAEDNAFVRLISDDNKVRRGFRKNDIFKLDDEYINDYCDNHIFSENRISFKKMFSVKNIRSVSFKPVTIECRCLWDNNVSYRWYSFTLQRYHCNNDSRIFLFLNDVHEIRTRQLENQLSLAKAVKDAKNTVFNQSKVIIENYNNALDVLSSVVEYRSLESGEHIHRIKYYTELLLVAAIEFFPEEDLTDEKIVSITNASVLHDVGKIGIPDNILLKPGKLTKDEFEIIKKHTIIGSEIAERIRCFGNDSNTIAESNYSYNICRFHHERFDGKGYPDGLKGNDIPFCAQIVSVADVYDALTHERVYKPAYDPITAQNMILNGECGTFSPRILKCFEQVKNIFEEK